VARPHAVRRSCSSRVPLPHRTPHGCTPRLRPDEHRWRPFASLSGGQQALASLALSLALQAVRPSPFVFLDEVDAALDTAAAGRVACVLRAAAGYGAENEANDARGGCEGGGGGAGSGLSGSRTQFILVSHKPQVKTVIGVRCAVQPWGRGCSGRALEPFVWLSLSQVFERCSCLVGVYGAGAGGSAAVVAAGLELEPAAGG
jgi:hypothetical protein